VHVVKLNKDNFKITKHIVCDLLTTLNVDDKKGHYVLLIVNDIAEKSVIAHDH
jgi:hypothetical protein